MGAVSYLKEWFSAESTCKEWCPHDGREGDVVEGEGDDQTDDRERKGGNEEAGGESASGEGRDDPRRFRVGVS